MQAFFIRKQTNSLPMVRNWRVDDGTLKVFLRISRISISSWEKNADQNGLHIFFKMQSQNRVDADRYKGA